MDLNDYTSLPLPITTFTNTNNFLLPPPKPTFKAQNPSYTAPPNPNAPNPNAPNLNNNNNNSKNNNLPNEGIILNNIGHHGDVDQNMDGNRDMSGFIDGNKILPAYQTRRSTRQLEPTVLPFKATNEGLSPDRPRPILPTNSLSCHQCKTRRMFFHSVPLLLSFPFLLFFHSFVFLSPPFPFPSLFFIIFRPPRPPIHTI